jgi:hypothetical protein
MMSVAVKNINLDYLAKYGEEILEISDIPVGKDILLHIADYEEKSIPVLIEKYGKKEIYQGFKDGKWDLENENDAVKEIRLLLMIFKKYEEFDGIFNIEIPKNEKKFLIPSCTGNILGTVNLK